MLNVIRIKNYQALKNIELALSPRINVLEGPSDVGKSSVVRALTGLLYQQSGGWFVRDGAKKAEVTVVTPEHEVTWQKGKTTNSYTCDGTKIGKPGRKVPEEVVDALRIKPVDFGAGVERRLNVQQQGERGFLIEDEPADGARILGSMTGAAALASAVRQCSADVGNKAKEVAAAERQVADAVVRLKEFEDLDVRAAVLSDKEAAIDALRARVESVEVAQGLVADCRAAASNLKEAKARHTEANKVAGMLLGVSELVDRAKKLKDVWWLVEESSEAEAELANRQSRHKSCKTLADGYQDVSSYVEQARKLVDVQALLHDIDGADNSVQEAQRILADVNEAAGVAEYDVACFRETNPTCPLCGQKWGG
jgi:DNA repair ATPase RecN